MTNEQRIPYVREQLEKIVQVLEVKGRDYGASHDVHINFRTVADLLGQSKYQVLAVYLLKHVQSVTNAITKQPLKPQTGAEPIEGRLIDIINYCLIMMCMLKEDDIVINGIYRKDISEAKG